MLRKKTLLVAVLLIALSIPVMFTANAQGQRWQEPIVIGWTPPDITGVFKTATDFFEASAASANEAGFNVQVISQSPRYSH